MNRASAFGRAGWVAQQLAYTAISYDLYKGNPKDADPDAIDDLDVRRYAHVTRLPGTHFYASFGHLAGYSSAYYTYLWDKVIAEDFFTQFNQQNLLAGRRPCATAAWFWSQAAPSPPTTWWGISWAAHRV